MNNENASVVCLNNSPLKNLRLKKQGLGVLIPSKFKTDDPHTDKENSLSV
jgi:hypothetical protein